LSAPVGHVDTPSGLHQAEPAAGHQAVPAAPQAASPPPVQAASPSIAGTDAGRPGHDAPIWVDVNPNTAYPGTLDVADVRLAGPPPAPGDLAAAPSGAADAAGSVDLLDLDDGLAGAGTDAGRPGHDAILDGMQALRDEMGALKAALTAMPPPGHDAILDGLQALRFNTATTDDMAAWTTELETGFDEMWTRLDAMEKRMSKRFNDMEEKVQSFQDGWKLVPEEDDASGATNEWDVSWSWNPRWPARWGWQGCRRRRTPEDGARGSR